LQSAQQFNALAKYAQISGHADGLTGNFPKTPKKSFAAAYGTPLAPQKPITVNTYCHE